MSGQKDRLPRFELAGPQQSAVDLMLSPDETHVFIGVAERPAGAKNTIVPSSTRRKRWKCAWPRINRPSTMVR